MGSEASVRNVPDTVMGRLLPLESDPSSDAVEPSNQAAQRLPSVGVADSESVMRFALLCAAV